MSKNVNYGRDWPDADCNVREVKLMTFADVAKMYRQETPKRTSKPKPKPRKIKKAGR